MANQFPAPQTSGSKRTVWSFVRLKAPQPLNEQEINERGLAFRRTHSAGMVPSGMVGNYYRAQAERRAGKYQPRTYVQRRVPSPASNQDLIGQYISYRH